jgi:hypothetical protein
MYRKMPQSLKKQIGTFARILTIGHQFVRFDTDARRKNTKPQKKQYFPHNHMQTLCHHVKDWHNIQSSRAMPRPGHGCAQNFSY